jgi:hypothetical protein
MKPDSREAFDPPLALRRQTTRRHRVELQPTILTVAFTCPTPKCKGEIRFSTLPGGSETRCHHCKRQYAFEDNWLFYDDGELATFTVSPVRPIWRDALDLMLHQLGRMVRR